MAEEAQVIPLRTTTINTKRKAEMRSWFKFGAILLLAYIIINNSVGLTKVSGHSMNPSLSNGSILLMNKASLLFSKPMYGDVIVINDDRLDYSIIKRVIAVPDDEVAIVDGIVYVNQFPLPELYTYGQADDMTPIVVSSGKLFVMGDNRAPGESLDSRDTSLGLVNIQDIKGYAGFSIFPMHKISKPLTM